MILMIYRLTLDFIARGRESVASFSTCVYPMESIVIALMSLDLSFALSVRISSSYQLGEHSNFDLNAEKGLP